MSHHDLQAAWAALDNQEWDRAVEVASPLVDAVDPDLAAQARKVVGQVHFFRGNHTTAIPFLKPVAERTNDARDWFGLAMAQTLAGEVEAGSATFARAIDRRKAEQLDESAPNAPPTWPSLIFFYMQALIDIGRHDLAVARLKELCAVYSTVGATDVQSLALFGIPDLSDVLDRSRPALEQALSPADAKQWLQSFADSLDAEGRHVIAEFISRAYPT